MRCSALWAVCPQTEPFSESQKKRFKASDQLFASFLMAEAVPASRWTAMCLLRQTGRWKAKKSRSSGARGSCWSQGQVRLQIPYKETVGHWLPCRHVRIKYIQQTELEDAQLLQNGCQSKEICPLHGCSIIPEKPTIQSAEQTWVGLLGNEISTRRSKRWPLCDWSNLSERPPREVVLQDEAVEVFRI